MERRRRTDGQARLAVELYAPRWAVRSVGLGLLVLGVSNAAAVVVVLAAR